MFYVGASETRGRFSLASTVFVWNRGETQIGPFTERSDETPETFKVTVISVNARKKIRSQKRGRF